MIDENKQVFISILSISFNPDRPPVKLPITIKARGIVDAYKILGRRIDELMEKYPFLLPNQLDMGIPFSSSQFIDSGAELEKVLTALAMAQ